ncbi:MAG: 3-oxoadipate enol-lactonase [Phycisphaerales bacterium]|nr:3-oxoadipate enol-lactonase [Phycisphaerales bacterium]
MSESIHFHHGTDVLSGVLTIPSTPGPHPAIALVPGSGAQDRDYGGMARRLSAHFARIGFAALSWDKPGVGQSAGDFNQQTLYDRAEETIAAVRYLQGRADIRKDCVGLWGHSQGGMVVPIAAAKSKDIAFLIEVSGWQGPAWQQDAIRVEAELRADGFSEEDVHQARDFARKRMDLIRGNGDFEELEAAQQHVKDFPWFAAVHLCDRTLFYAARRNVNLDVTSAWEGVHCPVLVLYGDKDTSGGPPEPLIDIIRKGLTRAQNDRVRVQVFHHADHCLYASDTGSSKEAKERARQRGDNPPEFAAGYLETMAAWLKEVARPGG